MNSLNETIISSLNELSKGCNILKKDDLFLKKYESWINKFISSIKNGGTIYICGNGGSFAHAQHLTTELVVRYKKNRESIKSICLGSNQANLSAIGNDLSFDQIFLRELSGLYKSTDIVFILSTSGNSPNVIKVAEYVKEMGGNAISLLGKDGGKLKDITDNYIIPFHETNLIQEIQILIGHCICDELEKYICNNPTKN